MAMQSAYESVPAGSASEPSNTARKALSPNCGRISKALVGPTCFLWKRQWRVTVLAPDGKLLFAYWPETQEPLVDGFPPSAVVEVIAERNEQVFSVRSREQAARAALCLQYADALDRNWAMAEIQREQKTESEARDRIARLRTTYLSGDFE
jgi:hypothetical protein